MHVLQTLWRFGSESSVLLMLKEACRIGWWLLVCYSPRIVTGRRWNAKRYWSREIDALCCECCEKREKRGKISRTKLHPFFFHFTSSVFSSGICKVHTPSAGFQACIFLALFSKPVFLRQKGSSWTSTNQHRTKRYKVDDGQHLQLHMILQRSDRSSWYLEMTLEVVQGEPFHSHQPQHRLGRRFCRRTAQSNGKRCQSHRNRSCNVIATRSPDQWIC